MRNDALWSPAPPCSLPLTTGRWVGAREGRKGKRGTALGITTHTCSPSATTGSLLKPSTGPALKCDASPSQCQHWRGRRHSGRPEAARRRACEAAPSCLHLFFQLAHTHSPSCLQRTKDTSGQTWDAARDTFYSAWRSTNRNWDDAMSSAWEQWQVGGQGGSSGRWAGRVERDGVCLSK